MGNHKIGHFPGQAGDKALKKAKGNQTNKQSMIENDSIARDLPQTMLGPGSFRVTRRKTRGAVNRRRERVTLTAQTVSLVDTETYIHLQVRRFAGCPNGQRGMRFQRKGDRLCHH
jgi:hypothetical protein